MSRTKGPRFIARLVRLATLPVTVVVAMVAIHQRFPLFAAIAVAGACSWFAGVSRGRHHATWLWPTGVPLQVGDTTWLRTMFTNEGHAPTAVMTVVQSIAGHQVATLRVPSIAPGERFGVEVRIPLVERRGPAPLQQRTRVHNRLTTGSIRLDEQVSRTLLPAVRPRPDLPPPEVLLRPSWAAREEGPGSGRRGFADPLQLRRFTSGDPTSSVHWRSSARAGTPIVLEREEPATACVVLLVAGSGSGEAWEAAVCRAAGLVEAAHAIRLPVTVVAAAPAVAPAAGSSSGEILDWLAGLGGAGALSGHLAEHAVRLARGGLVAVLSADPLVVRGVSDAAGTETLDLRRPW